MAKQYNEESRLEEQIDLLVQALETNSQSLRNVAIVQISMFGSKAVPHLVGILKNSLAEKGKPQIRNESKNPYLESIIDGILKSLGIIQDESAVEAIANALPRKEAVEALAKIGGARSLDLIMMSIEGPLDDLGNQKGALRNFIDPEQSSSPANDRFVKSIFSFLGEQGKLRLKEDLKSTNPRRHAAAVGALRAIHEKDSIPDLMLALKSHDLPAKAEAARALQELGASEAAPLLVKELFDIERRMEDLELSQSKEVSDLLAYDQLREARKVTEKAILQLNNPDALVEVGLRLVRRGGNNFTMRPEFREAIVTNGDLSIPALTKFLAAQDRSVQRNAAELIAEIKKSKEPKDDVSSKN